jgi:hypothetical protein
VLKRLLTMATACAATPGAAPLCDRGRSIQRTARWRSYDLSSSRACGRTRAGRISLRYEELLGYPGGLGVILLEKSGLSKG